MLHQSWSTGWNEPIAQWVHPMKDRSEDPSHHEQTLLPRSYILLCCTRTTLPDHLHNLNGAAAAELGSILYADSVFNSPFCSLHWRTPLHLSLQSHLYTVRLLAETNKEGNVLFTVIWHHIWLRTILIVRKETCCHHTVYSLGLAARVLLYARSHGFVTPVVEHWQEREIAQWVHPMKDRSDDPSHHEQTLLPQSYISLRNEQ